MPTKYAFLSEVKSVSSATTGLVAVSTSVAVEVDCCGAITTASMPGLPSAVSIVLTCSSYEVAEVGDWISTFYIVVLAAVSARTGNNLC